MISILSMALNAVISFALYIVKAFFSMLLWFAKGIFRLGRFFFALLPITSIAFHLFVLGSILIVINLVPDIPGLSDKKEIIFALFKDLGNWWTTNIYAYHGMPQYIILLLLTVLMAIPVLTVFLLISVFTSFSEYILWAVMADIAFYVLRAVLGKSFAFQFLDRYYRMFPDAGKKHYEKNYEKWLRRHHRDFEEDTEYDNEKVSRRRRAEAFYEDEYDEDDYNGYDDETDEYDSDYDDDYRDDCDDYEDGDDYGDEYDDYVDDNYEDDEYDDNEYEDDEFGDDEDDDNYEDDYAGRRSERRKVNSSSESFNFFAGCNDLESVNRKYKSLAKLYHPDNLDGDTKALQEINVQYEEAKRKFR